jgi:peptidoglycan hydrolase-like protein with peptidoglycan-binding domain
MAATAVVAATLNAPPADATTRVMPGSFTGYAFDACQAPSQEAMDVWRERSPYWGVGIYTSGVNRYCDEQENLDEAWVSEQSRKGWRLLPIHVGLQASCANVDRWRKISGDPTDGYAEARAQGRAEAREAAAAARGYGIAAGSVLWYDLEHFDTSRTRCRESALALVSAWTGKLHGLGFRSGFYSSGSSGIRMLDEARRTTPGKYALPDLVWVADWNGKATTRSSYLSADAWMPHARVHQYTGSHYETYGGVRIEIDSNYMDVGRGSVAGKASGHCGVRVDFGAYRHLQRGDRTDQVAALECFLRKAGHFDGPVNTRFGAGTARAVRRLQRAQVLPVTGQVDRRTWTVLLARGTTPLLKYGSAGNAVRRLQRSLNAANREGLTVDGVFAGSTRSAVRRYQADRGLARTGVVTTTTWTPLRDGRS